MKYIVLVPLTHPLTHCSNFPISFANDIVQYSRIYLFACLVRWQYSIASPVSSYMVYSAYLGGVVFSDVSIFIATAKRFRHFFLPALPHSASVLLELLTVHQLPLTFSYGICTYCVVGKWDLG